MNQLQAQELLTVMECLIDTVDRTTDLENVYDHNDESVTWVQVWDNYRALKVLAGVE